MAFAHGKTAFFSIDDSGGTPRDLSTYINSISMPRSIETAETTTFSVTGSAKTFIVGLNDSSISISGMFDSTADGYIAGALGQSASLSFVYGPTGNTVGMIKYSGECFMTKYDLGSQVGDVVSASVDYQVTSTVTRGTF